MQCTALLNHRQMCMTMCMTHQSARSSWLLNISQLQGVNPLHRLVEKGYFPHCQEPLYFDPISVLFPTISIYKLKASKSPKHTSFHAATQACEVVHVLSFFFLPDKDLH